MNHVYGGTADEVVIILNTLRDESAILLAFFLLVRFLGLSFGESCGHKSWNWYAVLSAVPSKERQIIRTGR